MKYGSLYGVYEDGKLIFEGTRQEIANKFDSTISNVNAVLCGNSNNFLRKYQIVCTQEKCEYEYRAQVDTTFVCCGSKRDVSKFTGVSIKEIERAIKQKVSIDGFRFNKKLVKNVEKYQIDEDKKLKQLEKHLKMFGNTIIKVKNSNELNEYVSKLKKDGFDVVFRKSMNDFKCYILEV